MPLFDFQAARARISEYEFRTQPAERRGPTQPLELPEPEGWWSKIRETFSNSNVVCLAIPLEELERVRNVDMGELQIKWHNENDIIDTEDEVAVDETGRIFLIYQAHGFTVIWGKEIAARILADLEKNANKFNESYPPGNPKHDDRRFKENYSTDKATAIALGYECGIRHISFRREEGQPHQTPALTDETIASRRKLQAVDQFMRDITPVKQTIGMSLSAILPETYEKNRAIVENWSEESIFKGLVHTEREIATTTVLNTNVAATPHYDPNDYDDGMTGLHAWGDYNREKGGELSVPVLARSYRMYPDSILWLRSGKFLHLVRRPIIDGQRFSMVHTTQPNMADFESLQEPPTPEQKSELQKDARKDEISCCPFCQKQFSSTGGVTSINKHLQIFSTRGLGDDKHDLNVISEWKKNASASAEKKGKDRRKERREENRKGEELETDATEVISAPPPPKRRKIEKLKPSTKYERYGAELFRNTFEKDLYTSETHTEPRTPADTRVESTVAWTFSPPIVPVGQPELQNSIVPRWRESEQFAGHWLCDLGNDVQRSYYKDGSQTQWVRGPFKVVGG